jgi:hypothetical protein
MLLSLATLQFHTTHALNVAPDASTLLLCVLLLQLSKAERHRDLISISVVHTLNAALCEFHLQNCPPSQQLRDVCNKAQAMYLATKVAVRQLDVELSCVDRVVSAVTVILQGHLDRILQEERVSCPPALLWRLLCFVSAHESTLAAHLPRHALH